MDYRLKEIADSIFDTCDLIDKHGMGIAKQSSSSIAARDVLRMDLTRFLIYLSASDNDIDISESKVISDYLDWNITAADIKKLIADGEFVKSDFAEEVPFILLIFISADNEFYKHTHDSGKSLCDLLIKLYSYLGRELLISDANVSSIEIERLRNYLSFLKENAEEKLDFYIDIDIDDIFNQIDITQKPVQPINKETQSQETDEETLEDLLSELNSLTGLSDVKKDVNSLINLLQIRKIREERGLPQMPMSLHLVFSGNPGTGKTTVARLLSKIYHKLGVLSKGHLTEVDRSGLVAGYVGQTAIKVQEVLQKALGGVLFIDEAYSLTSNKGENDYGLEAVDTLLKGMEDHRDDLIVIVAGYPDLLNDFLNSNPGLRSRFNKFINFADYTPPELFDIFKSQCTKAGYTLTAECESYVKKYFEKKYLTRNSNFANGRDVRNFFELAMVYQANRLSSDYSISNEELTLLTLADVEEIII